MIPKQQGVCLESFLWKKHMRYMSLEVANARIWILGANWGIEMILRITSDLEDRPVDITLIYIKL